MSIHRVDAAIPVNIITGALGAGKTTVIAKLLADKPAQESWLVILNEFTDTGIDTLTLAIAARGAYDVRMIAGGCLCCTGEEDFRRQLSSLLAQSPAHWPARILIEPSGIGHPGALIEELRLFERSGAIRLHSTVALLDAQARAWMDLNDTARAQVEAADVLLLSKADLVNTAQREAFMQWATSLFPPKRLLDCIQQGALPPAALTPAANTFTFSSSPRPQLHTLQRRSMHVATAQDATHSVSNMVSRELYLAQARVQATTQRLLGRVACGWIIPNSVLFDLPQLQALLAHDASWQGVERYKAVLRTGIDGWHLLQRWRQQYTISECNWRQDSRIEVQMSEGQTVDWSIWDRRWQSLSEPNTVF